MTDERSDLDKSLTSISWTDLVIHAPALASLFALTYVVGYFYAFDIAWFPFFSFTEQLVFALRALPTAIGAFVVFLIAVHHFYGREVEMVR